MSLDANDVARALRAGNPTSDFDLAPDVVLPEGRKLRPAAVLICIDETGETPRIILIKRSRQLRHHPGQVAFPGGSQDPEDGGPVDAALREAREEIGLPNAEILGSLSPHETVTGFQITPVLARLSRPFTPVIQQSEVDEIFTAPLDFLMTPSNFRVEQRRWQGQWRSFYVVPYGPYYIWGATARMMKALADQVAHAG